MALNIPQNIIVHHSLVDSEKDQLDGINNGHKRQNFPKSSLGYYVGYHYLINWKGKVTQTRDDRESGAHTSQSLMNFRSIGICLEGNFDKREPSVEQCKALYNLIHLLCKRYGIDSSKIYPHRHFAKYKSCWGANLPNDIYGYIERRIEEEKEGRPISTWAQESAQEAKERGLWKDQKNPDEPALTMKGTYYLKKLGLLTKIPKDKDGKDRPTNIEELNHAFYKFGFDKFSTK